MTYNISLDPDVESKLQEMAAEAGQDLGTFLKELINANVKTRKAKEQLSDWCSSLDEWIAGFPEIPHFVDDSRESTYAGRCE